MALFVDGPAVVVDSLTEYDTNVLSVAASEGINLTTKIQLAQEQMYLEINRWLRRSSFRETVTLSGIHYGIEHVVWSKAMRVWQVYQALAFIYRDAYYSQLNDRHQARAKEYEKLANKAQMDFAEYGLGMVQAPLKRPQQPVASLVPAQEAGGTYYFAVTYTNDAGQESSASGVLSVEVTDGNAVDLTLAPPLSGNATGWNLYAGASPEQMVRQNDGALVLTADWAYLPSLAVTDGAKAGPGQAPDQHWPLHRYLQRG
jgi:hypothetical protein